MLWRFVWTMFAAVFLLTLLVASILGQVRGVVMPFQVATTAFSAGETIPKKFTCDGPDVSPQLGWKEAPAGTQSFALIMDDPDAPVGTWVHWVLYNVPANITELQEGVEKPDFERAMKCHILVETELMGRYGR